MDIHAYINSGILELYVAGTLSEKESQEVYALMQKHPELLEEVKQIEATLIKLSAALSPSDTKVQFSSIKTKINLDTKIVALDKPKTNWYNSIGWAASLLLAVGLLWTLNQNNTLKTELETVETDKQFLEEQIDIAKDNLKEANNLVSILRDRSILKIPLAGQAISPESYVNVYWDKKTNSIYLDVEGLPNPPEGKVYQVWSLTLNPLTPTSLGTIDDFTTDENKIFTIANANASEAFGITLEPAGGSDTPTLEQLYTLGAVETTP